MTHQRELVRLFRRDVQLLERFARFASESRERHDMSVPRCPLILRIEVTNRCNANCVFCAYQYQERPIVTMTFETFRKVVDEYTALGGTAINFSPVVGEALIDKNLEEKVGYARQFPQYTKLELWTNGILLTKARFESIVAAGINQIHIALSGFSEAEYERVYRNGNYRRVFRNLTEIAQSSALERVSVCVHSRTDSLSPEQSPDYLELRRLGKIHVVFEPGVVSWHGAIKQEDLPNDMFLVAGPVDQRKPCFLLWGGANGSSGRPDDALWVHGCERYGLAAWQR